MAKKFIKIGVYATVPIGITSIATGLYFGLKSSKNEDDTIKLTPEVEYFQNQILGSKMQYSFLFPRNGENLLDKFILLDKEIMSDRLFQERMMKKTPKNSDGSLKVEKLIKINFNSLKGETEINERFSEVNKELFDFANENKLDGAEGRWGLHWESNSKKNAINILIYKIDAEDPSDIKTINDYIEALKSSKVHEFKKWISEVNNSNLFFGDGEEFKGNSNKIDFIPTIQSTLSLKSNQMMTGFPFLWKESASDNGKSDAFNNCPKLYETNLWTNNESNNINIENNLRLSKTDNPDVKLVWSDGLKIPYKAKYSNKSMNLKQYYFNKELIEKQIISVVKPFFDFSKANNNPSKIKLLFTFYKLDRNSQIDFTNSNDIVKNPKNIYSRIIELNWTEMLDAISNPSEKELILSPNNVKETIFNRINVEWMKYISNPIVKTALPFLSKFFPAIGRETKNLVDTFSALKKIKDSNLKIKNEDAFNYIFKVPYGNSSKNIIDRIFDGINSTNYLKPQSIFKIWFEDFKGDKDSKWTKWETFSKKSNITNETRGFSNAKEIYYFYAGAHRFEPIIRKRLEQLISSGLIKNYYDVMSSNEISNFIKDLKNRKILKDKTFSVVDFSNEEKRNKALVEIIKAIRSGDTIKFPKVLFNLLNVGEYISIVEPIINGDYVKDILDLVIGNGDVTNILDNLLKDPLNTISENLTKNIDKYKDASSNLVNNILKTLKDLDTKELNKLINALNVNNILKSIDPKYQPLVDGLINGFGNETKLENVLNPIIGNNEVKIMIIDSLKNMFNGNLSDILITLFNFDQDKVTVISNILKRGIRNSSEEDVVKMISILKPLLKLLLKSLSNNKIPSYLQLIFSEKTSNEYLGWLIKKFIN